jgi:uncharacterized protein with HEPN domain
MRRDFEFYLWDVTAAISDIQTFVADMSFDQYLANRMVQRAVERSFEIVGEALKQADQHYPGQLVGLPDFTLAVRFRDRLAHGYFTIKQEIVWDIIHQELPPLHEAITALLLGKNAAG